MRTACIIIFTFLLLVGCNEDAMNSKEIYVKGCVIDNITKSPIPYAKVTLLCWYHAGWDKTDYVSIDTITDVNGCYSAKFEEGYKVVVASVAANYYPNLRAYEELNKNNIEVNLALSRSSGVDTTQPKINLRYYIVQNSSN
jgi:hypothetical protein